MKYSNYKVFKCFKLVFRKIVFYTNFGSVLTIFYFLGYLSSFILFCIKRIYSLNVQIKKLFENRNIDNIILFNKNNILNTNNKSHKSKSKKESKKDFKRNDIEKTLLILKEKSQKKYWIKKIKKTFKRKFTSKKHTIRRKGTIKGREKRLDYLVRKNMKKF